MSILSIRCAEINHRNKHFSMELSTLDLVTRPASKALTKYAGNGRLAWIDCSMHLTSWDLRSMMIPWWPSQRFTSELWRRLFEWFYPLYVRSILWHKIDVVDRVLLARTDTTDTTWAEPHVYFCWRNPATSRNGFGVDVKSIMSTFVSHFVSFENKII